MLLTLCFTVGMVGWCVQSIVPCYSSSSVSFCLIIKLSHPYAEQPLITLTNNIQLLIINCLIHIEINPLMGTHSRITCWALQLYHNWMSVRDIMLLCYYVKKNQKNWILKQSAAKLITFLFSLFKASINFSLLNEMLSWPILRKRKETRVLKFTVLSRVKICKDTVINRSLIITED